MSSDIPANFDELVQEESPEQETEAEPVLDYNSVYEFYEGIVAPILRDRHIDPRSGLRWCKRWWDYPEAMMRLDALWRSYEHLRQDPATGISVWFRDHFDVHMAVLTSQHGPFGKSRDVAERGDYPPYEQPPDAARGLKNITDEN